MPRPWGARAALALLVVAAIAAPGRAATNVSIRITPANVTLDAAHALAALTVTSFDASTVIFDADVVSWQQNGEVDRYLPATDIVVVPPVYDIGPFRTMLVRVGERAQRAAPATETAFQVRFREVLPAGTQAAARTVVAPVFVAPAERRDAVRYALERSGADAARLEVHDDGNVHVYLGNVQIRSGTDAAFSGSLDAYVLAGNARTFPLTLKHPLSGSEAELTIGSGGAEQTVHVPVR